MRNCSLYAIGNAFSTRVTYGKRVLLRVQLLILLAVALCNEQRLRNGDFFGQPNVVAECVAHAQWMLVCVPLRVCFALALCNG